MAMRMPVAITAVLALSLLVSAIHAARPVAEGNGLLRVDAALDKKPKAKHPFTSPTGLFIQERASKQLPGPGQHFSFGALVSWDDIHATVQNDPNAKLLLLVRHGQAVSNWLSDTLGPDEWFKVETQCSYTNDNGTVYGVFDAELTRTGQEEAQSLNSMLAGGGWFDKLTAGTPTKAVISPLSRCLQTAQLVTAGLPIKEFHIEELLRETLGEDTCDARRSVSDPKKPSSLIGPCDFEQGLASKFPQFKFPIVGSPASSNDFGMISDKDTLWTTTREGQKDQTKRAEQFLEKVFDFIDEKVVVAVTHSGFARSVMLAVGREPYRPQNTELVPIIVHRVSKADA